MGEGDAVGAAGAQPGGERGAAAEGKTEMMDIIFFKRTILGIEEDSLQ